MHRELLAQSPLLALPLVAMFLFVAVWIVTSIARAHTTSRRGRRRGAPAAGGRRAPERDRAPRRLRWARVRSTTSTTASSSTTTSCPCWWQLTLYGAIVFGLVYWFGRRLNAHRVPAQSYAQDVAAERAAEAERARARGTIDDAMLSAIARDPATLAQGKDVFTTHVRRLPPRRRRRQHRPEPDRRVLAPRRQADRRLQGRQRGRRREGHAHVGPAARRASASKPSSPTSSRSRTRTSPAARRRRASSRRGDVVANVHLPVADQPELPSAALPVDGRRHAIQPADVRGRFDRARKVVFVLLIGALGVAALGRRSAGTRPSSSTSTRASSSSSARRSTRRTPGSSSSC